MFMPSSFVGQPTSESVLKQMYLQGDLEMV